MKCNNLERKEEKKDGDDIIDIKRSTLRTCITISMQVLKCRNVFEAKCYYDEMLL